MYLSFSSLAVMQYFESCIILLNEKTLFLRIVEHLVLSCLSGNFPYSKSGVKAWSLEEQEEEQQARYATVESFSWSQMSLYTKVHHPSSFSF